jgi:Ca2+-binding RTX toxin-like protein
MFFRRNRKTPRPALRTRLQVESLEGRACPTGPIPPPTVNLDYVVNGMSSTQTQDLVVVTPVIFSTVRVTHHVGVFMFNAQGGVVPIPGTTPTLIKDAVVNMANRRLVVNAGPGPDIVVNFAHLPTLLNGGEQNDKLFGGPGSDSIDGGPGDDTLEGRGNNDTIYGGLDKDTMLGNEGHDILYGGAGDDIIAGGDGADHVYGEANSDILIGGNTQTDNDDGDVDYLDGNTHFDGITYRFDDGVFDAYFVEFFAPGGNGAETRRDILGTFCNHDLENRT